ncbi:MAG: 6-bladed beta-propeller [Candidatus Muiribacteriota bacterium]
MKNRRSIFILFIFICIPIFSAMDFSEIKQRINSGDLAGAISEIKKYEEFDDKNPYLYELRGDIQMKLGNLREGLRRYRQALINALEEEHREALLTIIEKVNFKIYQERFKELPKMEDYNQKKINISRAQNKNHELIDFDYNFGFDTFGRRLYGPQSFYIKDNKIYIIDNINFRITVFSAEGEFIEKFGQKGRTSGGLFRPADIIVDRDDNVYVMDMSQILRLIKFDKDDRSSSETRIRQFEQVDLMLCSEKDIYIKGVMNHEKKSVLYNIEEKLFEKIPDIYGDGEFFLTIEPVLGRLHRFNSEKKLECVFEVNYPEKTTAWSLIYADKECFIISARYITSREEENFEFETGIYKISYDGEVLNSFSFDSRLAGDIIRTRSYFYQKEKNTLYLPQIKENEYRILKFKRF